MILLGSKTLNDTSQSFFNGVAHHEKEIESIGDASFGKDYEFFVASRIHPETACKVFMPIRVKKCCKKIWRCHFFEQFAKCDILHRNVIVYSFVLT